MLGWSPSWTVEPLEGGGSRITATEAEWDWTERGIALAVDEIDAQACGGCGGDLSVNLTDKHPSEDDGDGHYHKLTQLWCRECVARIRALRQLAPADKELEGTPADNFPGARFFVARRLPIPDIPDSQPAA